MDIIGKDAFRLRWGPVVRHGDLYWWTERSGGACFSGNAINKPLFAAVVAIIVYITSPRLKISQVPRRDSVWLKRKTREGAELALSVPCCPGLGDGEPKPVNSLSRNRQFTKRIDQ